jgi:tetratricopeptide (TPR) repeat protein
VYELGGRIRVRQKLDDRYRELSQISRRGGRRTYLAQDSITGATVVVKTGPLPTIRREALCLLALPPGVAPAVLDLVWHGSGRLILVLEKLPGKSLQEAAPEISVMQVAHLAQAICQCLVSVHRIGWIHADLKPQDIFVLGDSGGLAVRLLDFGFAIDRFADLQGQELGGTPSYLAPELRRGWILDGRADLYSLGVILPELFPRLREDPKWTPILDKLVEEVPARRCPHAVALREELSATFGPAPGADCFPRFGAGPMRGRDDTLDRLLRELRTRPGGRTLVQARPGAGLTRFLQEAVLGVASANGSPTRIIDVPSFHGDRDLAGALDFLEGRRSEGESILCGVADPSPGLRWSGGGCGDRLRAALSHPEWQRLTLAPLDRESLFEIVVAGLGPEGRAARELALELHERAEGDLQRCADGFLHCVRTAGKEDGLGWHVDPALVNEALATWSPTPPEPRLADIPAHLVDPLRLCARAGRSLSERVAQGLLASFAEPGDLALLQEHGYLVAENDERLRFVTKSLFQEPAAAGGERSTDIDVWLNTHYVPDPDLVDEVLGACLRARRIGDVARESSYLAAALERADAQRRWQDGLRLLAYPDLPPRNWTVELVRQQVDTLAQILGSEWSRERLLVIAAMGGQTADATIELPLLEEAASGSDPKATVAALLQLVDRIAGKPGDTTCERHLKRLRALAEVSRGPSPGVLDFIEARRAMAAGKMEAASDSAEKAAVSLRGSGLLYESLNLQLLAVLRFSRDQKAATTTLCEAIATAGDAEMSAQMRYNLALMYNLMGKLELSAACADEGIRAAPDGLSRLRRLGLRTWRAWAWADLDRIEPAREEARALLRTSAVRSSPKHVVMIRLLLGYCHLHHGSGFEAIQEVAQAWEDASHGSPAAQWWDSLRLLVDTLLDLEAWDRVHEHGASISQSTDGNDPLALTTTARANALVAQEKGHLAAAAELLEERRQMVPALENLHARARYLHHLGIVHVAQSLGRLDAAAGERATGLFQEAIEILTTPGNGYYRAQALLGLAGARRAAGDSGGASAALDRAVAGAREIGSRGILAKCLQTRARMHMEGP